MLYRWNAKGDGGNSWEGKRHETTGVGDKYFLRKECGPTETSCHCRRVSRTAWSDYELKQCPSRWKDAKLGKRIILNKISDIIWQIRRKTIKRPKEYLPLKKLTILWKVKLQTYRLNSKASIQRGGVWCKLKVNKKTYTLI